MGAQGRDNSGKLRVRDIFVILFCLSGAAYSINLFWLDLNQTLNSQSEPIGTITVKNNIVQRRIAKRVIWDRLFNESPVYLGDMIRVADLSSADLNIDENQIGLEENTLVLIQRSPNGDGRLQINLASGRLNLETPPEGSESTVMLNIMGHEVTVNPGAKLRTAATENGMEVQVIQGSAQVKSEGQERELTSGSMIAMDTEGTEQVLPAVVMVTPRPNAHILATDERQSGVTFSWNRVNLKPEDTLRLEVAEDRNFTRIVQSMGNLNTRVVAPIAPGLSYWRLSLGSTVLSAGQVTVTDGTGPTLIRPVRDQELSLENQSLSFQWSEVDEASHYILQAGNTPDFSAPRITKTVGTNSFTDSNPGVGTWYWRVLPVFPPVYEGSATYSSVAVFRVTQIAKAAEPDPVLPVAVVEAPPEPPPPPPRPAPPPPRPAAPRPAATPRPAPRPDVAPEPRPTVVPPRLLPAAQNRRPVEGARIGVAELRSQRNIVFSWSAVPGANAYIVTLQQEGANGRREIIKSDPVSRTSWTLDNLQLLDRGNFVWQVEAVSMEENGTIVQRGTTAENTLILDIPLPGEVMLEQPGVLYGN